MFRDGSETPPANEPASPAAQTDDGQTAREREEEADVRLANAEIERAERAEREHRGQTLEMLVQMFPGILFLCFILTKIWIRRLLKLSLRPRMDGLEFVLIFALRCQMEYKHPTNEMKDRNQMEHLESRSRNRTRGPRIY